jgi:hypothetical protein
LSSPLAIRAPRVVLAGGCACFIFVMHTTSEQSARAVTGDTEGCGSRGRARCPQSHSRQ